MCVWACVCFVNSVSRQLRVPLFPLYLFICWGCWFSVQLFSIRANLFLSIYTTKPAHAHAFCGPPPHKLLSLIMRRSSVLRAPVRPPLATGNGTFWTQRPVVLWLSSWLRILRLGDWPRSSWTDRGLPGCHRVPLTLGLRQILWWVIKPNSLCGWRGPRPWMLNVAVALCLRTVSLCVQSILTLSGSESV